MPPRLMHVAKAQPYHLGPLAPTKLSHDDANTPG